MTIRRWTGTDMRGRLYADLYVPPQLIFGAVGAWGRTLADARAGGYPMLGRRAARQWLKELGQRRPGGTA